MQVIFFEHENNKHADIAATYILTIVIDLLEFSSFAALVKLFMKYVTVGKRPIFPSRFLKANHNVV